jgi:DNA-binding transcriptional ArsR family regulator
MMEPRTDPRQPRVVDLRRSRSPEIEIVACETYDFLLTLHVALASPERDYSDYDVGSEWCATARERCKEADPEAFRALCRYFGSLTSGGLHATLISLVAECPAPRDVPGFLTWLGQADSVDLMEALLDQDDLGADWPPLLRAAVAQAREGVAEELGTESASSQLLRRFAVEVRPNVATMLADPDAARVELAHGLRVWEAAVFAPERPRVVPALARQVRELERQRAQLPLDEFIRVAMHNVEWQRHVGLRRIIFAPSYFSGPAVFYHFRRGTLTFCLPVQPALMHEADAPADPLDPNDELLGFFMALGDPTRLRILRLLSEREMYLTELAEHLYLTKATTKHHMVKLRAAQLVTLYDRDRMTFYALVPEVQRRASQLLGSYLAAPARGAAAERSQL